MVIPDIKTNGAIVSVERHSFDDKKLNLIFSII